MISRDCYRCRSPHSSGDCDAKRVKVTCHSSRYCLTVKAYSLSGVKDEEYLKSCSAACSSSDSQTSSKPNYKCDVACCSSDYCNGNPVSLSTASRPPLTQPTSVTVRECYHCMSTQSLQDCDAKRTKIKCSGSCLVAMAYGTSGKEDVGYTKGCSKTCSAYDVPICNHHNVKCEVSCCSSDYCNGNLPLTSILTTPLPCPKPPEPVTSHVCYQCLSRLSFENCSSDYCNGNLPLTSIPTTPLPRPKPPEPVTSHVCYQCLSRLSFENCSSDYCNGNLPLTSILTTPLPRPKPPEPVTSHVCYQSLSRHSFENCDRRRFKVKCKNWQPCVKASSEEYYFKRCTTTCVASKIWICNLRNVDCRVHCCYSDLCNDASIPKDSGLILIVIASFMYFFGL